MIFSRHFYDTYITYEDNTQLYWLAESSFGSRAWNTDAKEICNKSISAYRDLKHAHRVACYRRGRLFV